MQESKGGFQARDVSKRSRTLRMEEQRQEEKWFSIFGLEANVGDMKQVSRNVDDVETSATEEEVRRFSPCLHPSHRRFSCF